LIPSNAISKLTTLPHHSTHHLATPPHLRFNFFNFVALTNFLHYITVFGVSISVPSAPGTVSRFAIVDLWSPYVFSLCI